MASLVTDMQELDVEHINNKYNQNQKVVASVDNNTKIENAQYLEFKNSTKQPSDDNKQINSPFNGFTQGF